MSIHSTSHIKIPDGFIDPISQDLLIQPVRTNCLGYNRWSIVNWLKGYPAFQGHIFEKTHLSIWFTKSDNHLCPFCRREITKIAPDTELALRIQSEFVLLNPTNAEYFQELKRELFSTPPDLINKPIKPQKSPDSFRDRDIEADPFQLNVNDRAYEKLAFRHLANFRFFESFRVWFKLSILRKIRFLIFPLLPLLTIMFITNFTLYFYIKLKNLVIRLTSSFKKC
ncbi:MAG: hypothetical protein WCT85_04035 [Parachlamydiales bacterium]|jgi:hypothetical protein